MIQMLEIICSIPENIGWVIVGVVGTLALEMCGSLIYTVVKMIRERMADDETEED